jgi:CHAT domain-containing protein/Tfp pilus assembly protein PilF
MINNQEKYNVRPNHSFVRQHEDYAIGTQNRSFSRVQGYHRRIGKEIVDVRNIYKGGFSISKYVCLSLLGVFLLSPVLVSVPDEAFMTLAQANSTPKDIADRLNQEGMQALRGSQNQVALEKFQTALNIYKQIGDLAKEGTTLISVGEVYKVLGQYLKALEIYQQALVINKKIGNRSGEGIVLGSLGFVFYNLGQYPKALEAYQQSLVIFEETGDRVREAKVLSGIGLVYISLGQYQKALEILQQSLLINKKIGNSAGRGATLNAIGLAYISLEKYPQALESLQLSLEIRRDIGDRAGVVKTYLNLGTVYISLRKYPQALESLKQSLSINKEIGDRAIEGVILGKIGQAYSRLGQNTIALENYYKSLIISREVGYLAVEAGVLSGIGYSYSAQRQPETAISFLKQAINIIENIRKDNLRLTPDLRLSYRQTVESTYRGLAELLISQGRLLEAQKVLELLKIQEIKGVDPENRATLTSAGIEYTSTEQEIKKQHGTLVALGEKSYACETASKCTETQKEQFRSQLQALQRQFVRTLADAESKAQTNIRDKAVEGKTDFIKGNQKLVEAQLGTLLIYPFVTENKIWLLWTSARGVYGSTEMPNVGRVKLLKAVQEYRNLLQTPTTDPAELAKLQQSGQQLYQWLIKPLEPALASKTIKHLIFSLDGTTRYIPISALVTPDNKYLIEQYDISTVLSVGLTNTSDRLPKSPQLTSILGLGVSLGFPPEFKALKNVELELESIVKAPGDTTGLYPGQKFLNTDFNQRTLTDHIKGQNIIHMATHAKYLSTNPRESFLLLGNGQKYMISEIEFLQNLGNVHLVVLSACETGLGETNPDGKEIQGISAYFTGGESKAKAVLSSLWNVNDASTSELMKSFYQNLSKGTMTKSEALRQSQLSMIKNTSPQNYSHPYYWAPFILIGNGL